jgi:hypothetical protein
VFIEHPLENSIASLSFTSNVLDEGKTFIFGSWICIANGLGGFISHLVDSRKPEAPAATRRCNLDSFIDDLDELMLPDPSRQIEKTSVFDVTSSCIAPGLLRSDSNRSEKASRSKSLPGLEEDLDRLFKIQDEGATVRRGPPVLDYDSDSNEESATLPVFTSGFWVCITDEVVASTSTLLKQEADGICYNILPRH